MEKLVVGGGRKNACDRASQGKVKSKKKSDSFGVSAPRAQHLLNQGRRTL
jgi:hypothetical protein